MCFNSDIFVVSISANVVRRYGFEMEITLEEMQKSSIICNYLFVLTKVHKQSHAHKGYCILCPYPSFHRTTVLHKLEYWILHIWDNIYWYWRYIEVLSMMRASNGNISALLDLYEGSHRSLVDSPHKSQSRGALMYSMIYAWTNG